jgi:Ser/Thr protein kinase RdoA (MazF antagonist)
MAQIQFNTIIETPSTFGALDSGHPAIPDLACATHATFHDLEMTTAIDATLASAERRWRISTAAWPTQFIHADYFSPNVLVTDGQVAGIIDFEFAGISHRAMDFAIGLVAFGAPHNEFVPMWEGMEASATGYLQTNPISDEERATMPDLILIREASSFVHWLGRMNQGLVSRDELRRRGRRLLDVEDWLAMNGRDLVARLARVDQVSS